MVGVTSNRLVDDDVHRDWLRRRYVDALTSHGRLEVVILPTAGASGQRFLPSLERLDGLVLTGDESNLDASVFRGSRGAGGDYAQNQRDRFRDRLAAAALRTALARGMPVLGICRGLQEMNVFFGGTLHEALERRGGLCHSEDVSLPRDLQYEPVHEVALAESGLLRGLLGSRSVKVNSLHGQGIDVVGPGLAVEATAPDGLVEALSVAGSPTFQLGVQWHPEWHADKDPVGREIFRAFGEACRAFRGGGGDASGQAAARSLAGMEVLD